MRSVVSALVLLLANPAMAQQAPVSSCSLSGCTLAGNLLFAPDGSFTIGAQTATRAKGAFLGANAAGWGYFAEIAVANTGGPILALNKARGSLGSEVSPNSGDQLGTVYFQGWNGTVFNEGVKVQAVTTEAWDATHNGAELLLRTTPNAATTAVTRWRITNDGQFVAGADNTYDLGSSSLRPRSAYLGTSLTIGAHAVLTSTQSFGSTGQLVINSDLGTNVNGNGLRIGTADANGLFLLWSANGTLDCDNGDASAFCSLRAGDITSSGNITSTSTGSIGWSVVTHANQACSTTCASGCAGGQDTDAATKPIVDCSDGSADRCFCAGAS